MAQPKIVATLNVTTTVPMNKEDIEYTIFNIVWLTMRHKALSKQLQKKIRELDDGALETDMVKMIPLDMQIEIAQHAVDVCAAQGYYYVHYLFENELRGQAPEARAARDDLADITIQLEPFIDMALSAFDMDDF